MLEQLIVDRIFKHTEKSPEAEGAVIALLEGAKEGHLCSIVEEDLGLPSSICSIGGDDPYPKTPLVKQGNRLYLQKNWALETLIIKKIREILGRTPAKMNVELPSSLQEAQVKALYIGSKQSLSIFTGGPGTGKTYTAGCFIRMMGSGKVIIAAPTGKAAAHLESALVAQGPLPDGLVCESTTLHRLLKLQPGMQRLYSDWKISADLVVVDEASMLDPSLLLHLLNAIGPQTRLLLLGDPNQLPPVEGGSLFPEIAELFGQKLERSIRMGEGPLLALSQAILAGNLSEIPYEPIDFDKIYEMMPNPVYPSEPDPRRCLEEQKRFRILSVLRQGPFGVDALNQQVLTHFKRKSGWLAIPILITQNDPKLQLYNGTTGVLIRDKGYFFFGEELRMISEGALPQYEPAFFLSVHKSQGSEFEEVLAIFPPGSERFGREALYTAVTRAKRRVTLWTDASTLEASINIFSGKQSGFTKRFIL